MSLSKLLIANELRDLKDKPLEWNLKRKLRDEYIDIEGNDPDSFLDLYLARLELNKKLRQILITLHKEKKIIFDLRLKPTENSVKDDRMLFSCEGDYRSKFDLEKDNLIDALVHLYNAKSSDRSILSIEQRITILEFEYFKGDKYSLDAVETILKDNTEDGIFLNYTHHNATPILNVAKGKYVNILENICKYNQTLTQYAINYCCKHDDLDTLKLLVKYGNNEGCISVTRLIKKACEHSASLIANYILTYAYQKKILIDTIAILLDAISHYNQKNIEFICNILKKYKIEIYGELSKNKIHMGIHTQRYITEIPIKTYLSITQSENDLKQKFLALLKDYVKLRLGYRHNTAAVREIIADTTTDAPSQILSKLLDIDRVQNDGSLKRRINYMKALMPGDNSAISSESVSNDNKCRLLSLFF